MIINSRNGNKTNENEYIDIYNDTVIAFIVGNEKIPFNDMKEVKKYTSEKILIER